jgi:molybdopterin-containing oxidoreductase family membrane subunit
MLAGSFGVFLTLFLLFIRFLPLVAMSEVKAVLPQANSHAAEMGHAGLETGKGAG